MTPHEATRTLVKSPPEVWAQCSEAEALDRHLNGSFGEIRITRLEPETAVAWEGDQVRGTVRIEPSAWGTRVTLTAQVEGADAPVLAAEAPVAVAPEAEPERPAPVAEEIPAVAPDPVEPPTDPDPVDPPAAPGRPTGLWARLARRFRAVPSPPRPREPGPAPPAMPPVAEESPPPTEVAALPAEPLPNPTPEPIASRPDPAEILNAALDSLGQAHHRPYSRA